jgi:hypothetical protein
MGMIKTIGRKLGAKRAGLLLAAVTSVAAIGAGPATANADTSWRIGINIGESCPPQRPVYEERVTRVWVEPVYRTVCDRVWVPATYRTECTRVWVPDRWEDETIVRGCGWYRRVEHVRVLVEPGHYVNQECQVMVCDGHWQNVERREVVCEGHWENRVERVAVARGYDRPERYEHFHFDYGHR